MLPKVGQGRRAERFISALHAAGAELGLDTSSPELLRLHGSGLYLLPRERVVVRCVESSPETQARARKALQVTTWLSEQNFPVAPPASERLLECGGVLVSVWHYIPQSEAAEDLEARARALGGLLRELHKLPAQPFDLPVVEPLARLRSALNIDREREQSVLPESDREFLQHRIAKADNEFQSLEFQLQPGLIHNDPHIGNLLQEPRSPDGYVLTDWESAARGPREIDLIQEGAPGNRFIRGDGLRHAFNAAYGYDVSSWPGWRVLRDLRDLHSLAAFIRAGADNPAARAQLLVRIKSLRTGDTRTRWTALA